MGVLINAGYWRGTGGELAGKERRAWAGAGHSMRLRPVHPHGPSAAASTRSAGLCSFYLLRSYPSRVQSANFLAKRKISLLVRRCYICVLVYVLLGIQLSPCPAPLLSSAAGFSSLRLPRLHSNSLLRLMPFGWPKRCSSRFRVALFSGYNTPEILLSRDFFTRIVDSTNEAYLFLYNSMVS